MLDRLIRAGFKYRTYEDIFVRAQISFRDAVIEAVHHISRQPTWVGIELDLDSIAGMPTSAESPCGITIEAASAFVHYTASYCNTAYLHLPEGAPRLGVDGPRDVGKALTQFVRTYISARESRTSE
jgi:formiminoglutamase